MTLSIDEILRRSLAERDAACAPIAPDPFKKPKPGPGRARVKHGRITTAGKSLSARSVSLGGEHS